MHHPHSPQRTLLPDRTEEFTSRNKAEVRACCGSNSTWSTNLNWVNVALSGSWHSLGLQLKQHTRPSAQLQCGRWFLQFLQTMFCSSQFCSGRGRSDVGREGTMREGFSFIALCAVMSTSMTWWSREWEDSNLQNQIKVLSHNWCSCEGSEVVKGMQERVK